MIFQSSEARVPGFLGFTRGNRWKPDPFDGLRPTGLQKGLHGDGSKGLHGSLPNDQ